MRTNLDIFRHNGFPTVLEHLLGQFEPTRFAPALDVEETKDHYIVRADLPGLKKEDIRIEAHEGVLEVSGERKSETKESGENRFFQERVYGKFQRSLRLPLDANLEKIEALYKDGVLTVAVSKTAEKTPLKVNVKTEDQEGFFSRLQKN